MRSSSFRHPLSHCIDLTFSKNNISLDGSEIAVRVEFSTIGVPNFTNSLVGSLKYNIRLIVLDTSSKITTFLRISYTDCRFPAAKISFSLSTLPDAVKKAAADKRNDTIKALEFYILNYVEFIKRAGYHVFYSLPDFDSLASRTDLIDYSLESINDESFYDAPRLINGIDIETINYYLKTVWHNIAAKFDYKGGLLDGHDEFSIIEHTSNWTETNSKLHDFHAKFGAPYVKMLCKHELVLFIDIDSIDFFGIGTKCVKS